MRRSLALLLLLSGCGLYFDGDDDPPKMCLGTGYGYEGAPLQLRDPSTGQCTDFGGGYGCTSYDADGCCTEAYTDLAPAPDWGLCQSQCNALDEQTCLATSGCQASYNLYVGVPEDPTADQGAGFLGCWATAQSGPIQGGGCYNLDAWDCSRHDDCTLYYEQSAGESKFVQCGPEPTKNGCDTVDCGPGLHCEQQCYPCDVANGLDCSDACSPTCVPDNNNSTCDNVDCGPGATCVVACEDGMATPDGAMVPGSCYPTCIPTGGGDPGSCTGEVACDAAPPACPANTVAGIINGCWSGYCIPQADCGPHDPGTCEPATCQTLVGPPACPTGTVPGVLNGCYTGYCIPAASCPQAACEQLSDEQSCTARGDCHAVYSGDNCTCDSSGCTCQDLSFARCESWVVAL